VIVKIWLLVAEGVSTYEASSLPPPNPHLPHCTFKVAAPCAVLIKNRNL
jgi:hypothetical protein